MAVALKEDRPVRDAEAVAERPDGSRIPFIPYPTPLHDESGALTGAINMLVDITQSREAEDRFRLAVEAAPNGMVLTDAQGRIVIVNGEAEKLFGYERQELLGQPIETLIPSRLRTHHAKYRRGFSSRPEVRAMGAGRDLYGLCKNGSEVPVEVGLSPIETSSGLMVLAAIVDISERKRAEAQRDLLVAELNHRVKNTLAVVQGIAHQTLAKADISPDVLNAFEGRLVALGAAHGLLSQGNWEETSLSQLTAETLQASAVDEQRIAVSGPEALLQPREALALAMALHELCTNARKSGALSIETGRIALSWTTQQEPEPQLELVWREHGGPVVSPPSLRGFGTRMIEQALAQDLDAEVNIDFQHDGLVCSISAPLPESQPR
jgi:PAS domain S-box-containing protein